MALMFDCQVVIRLIVRRGRGPKLRRVLTCRSLNIGSLCLELLVELGRVPWVDRAVQYIDLFQSQATRLFKESKVEETGLVVSR